jgi:hypothetical protein
MKKWFMVTRLLGSLAMLTAALLATAGLASAVKNNCPVSIPGDGIGTEQLTPECSNPHPREPLPPPTHISIFIDGVQLHPDQEPFITNDRVMLPLRAVSEAKGIDATVLWDGSERTVRVEQYFGNSKDAKRRLWLKIDSHHALFLDRVWDNRAHQIALDLDVAPLIVGDRTFVPLRLLAEALDMEVTWDGPSRRVSIHTRRPAKVDPTKTTFRLERGEFGFPLYPSQLRQLDLEFIIRIEQAAKPLVEVYDAHMEVDMAAPRVRIWQNGTVYLDLYKTHLVRWYHNRLDWLDMRHIYDVEKIKEEYREKLKGGALALALMLTDLAPEPSVKAGGRLVSPIVEIAKAAEDLSDKLEETTFNHCEKRVEELTKLRSFPEFSLGIMQSQHGFYCVPFYRNEPLPSKPITGEPFFPYPVYPAP